VKGTLLWSFPVGVITLTGPVVAPLGTVVVISEAETMVNLASRPLNLTFVTSVRFVPRIVTAVPTVPEVGRESD